MNRLATSIFVCATFLGAAFFSVTPALTQASNATLSGTVIDPLGAVVPNTRVAAENLRTAVVLTTTTNEAGVYLFPSLQPGLYRLTAEASGFRRHIVNDVNLEVGGRININMSLLIATAGETVDVTVQAEALLLGTSTVGGVINGRQVQELPLPDRNALGLVLTQPGVYGSNFAGARSGAVNVTIDGINVMDQSINSGVNSVIFPNVDNVEEVRVVTSPVDAEFGRGSGQVQILTRSGSNDIHGSLYEYHRNTALNANNFFNNLRGEPRDSLIWHNFGGRLGGPIVRERTFFHFNYDGTRNRTAESITAATFTEMARQGIFRFYPGVENANANASTPTVDLLGNPVRPATALGPLQTVPLFGRDPNRPGLDRTGTIQRLLGMMPLPNDFRFGDGLNTAGYTWRRREDLHFNQYNLKIDHIINDRHRGTFSFTREDLNALNAYMGQSFPSSPGGKVEQIESLYLLRLTSTLSPRAFNEVYIGALRPRVRFFAPWELPGGKELLPTANNYPYLPVFSLAADPIPSGGDPQGRISPLYVYGDTFHLNKGKHDLKVGGELRFGSTNGFDAAGVTPRAAFGYGFGPGPQGINSFSIAGLGVNERAAQFLLADLSGSVDSVFQSFNAVFAGAPRFVDGEPRQRTWRQRELSLFVQDDFKLKPSLTLNLGMRYEFYGIPWDANGRTAGVVGGSTGLFGISGTSWADMYQPGRSQGSLTQVQLIGKGSPVPNAKLYTDDWNNFAPVVGLSWSIPYFGRDKTILRAGYSVAYPREALRLVDIVASEQPGLRTETIDTTEGFQDLTGIRLPLQPSGRPLDIVPLTDRFQAVWAFDNNLRTPYIQNWNLTVQRELPGGFMLDVRYVGSKGTKLIRTVNLNEVNIFETGILDAFVTTQAGRNAPLLDRLLEGFNLGLGPVNGQTVTGSASVRAFTSTRGYLANNAVGSFASYLNSVSVFDRGDLLRFADLPENWIVVNPQFAGAMYVGNFSNSSYHSLQLDTKKRFSEGWTLESNYTWSRSLGDEEGDSQSLLNSYRNGRNRQVDKRLLLFHRTHVFRNNGVWELPFGPDRRFLNSNNRILSRLLEGWQIGGIFNVFSGQPTSLYAAVSSFNQHLDNTATLVGSLPKSTGAVKHTDNGVVYFADLRQTADPSIGGLTSSQFLNTVSALKAITDASGNIIAVNPSPGNLGSLSQTYLEGPGAFRLDANLLKKFSLGEGKEFVIRGDAINLLNSPIFGDPITDINSTNFGRIVNAGGNRMIVLSGRISF